MVEPEEQQSVGAVGGPVGGAVEGGGVVVSRTASISPQLPTSSFFQAPSLEHAVTLTESSASYESAQTTVASLQLGQRSRTSSALCVPSIPLPLPMSPVAINAFPNKISQHPKIAVKLCTPDVGVSKNSSVLGFTVPTSDHPSSTSYVTSTATHPPHSDVYQAHSHHVSLFPAPSSQQQSTATKSRKRKKHQQAPLHKVEEKQYEESTQPKRKKAASSTVVWTASATKLIFDELTEAAKSGSTIKYKRIIEKHQGYWMKNHGIVASRQSDVDKLGRHVRDLRNGTKKNEYFESMPPHMRTLAFKGIFIR